MLPTYSLKFKQHLILEISCLQRFHTLTSGDLKWPLTSMKNNRDHLLTKGYQRAKFEVQASFTCDIVLQGFTRFSDFDLWWQMTFDLHEKLGTSTPKVPTYLSLKFKLISCVFRLWPDLTKIRIDLLIKCYLHTKFEVQATFNSWDIMFTRFWGFDLWWPQMTFDLHEKQ